MRAPRSWPEHRPYALAALDRLPEERRYDVVVASGGRVSGYFHAYSDLDLYAVQADSSGDAEDLEIEIEGVVVQINELPCTLLEEITAAVGRHRLTRADRRQAEAFGTYGKLFSRLVTGVVLRSNDEGERMLRALDAEEFRRLGITVHGLATARMMEDAAGAVELGDAEIATAASSRAIHSALDAVLFAAGDVHWGDALLFRRLAAQPALASVDRLARRQLSALFDASRSSEQILEAAQRACRVASVLASLAAVVATAAESAGRWEHLDRVVEQGNDAAAAFSVAVSFADCVCILGPRSEAALTETGVSRELRLE